MRKKGFRVFWFTLSALFFLCAIGWGTYLFLEEARVSETTDQLLSTAKEIIAQKKDGVDRERIPDYVIDPSREMPTVEVDEISMVAQLSFPSLNLELPVADDWSYDLLRNAPCRYSGTPYQAPMVILGHNYTRHFGKLTNLSVGDKVYLTDAEGYVFSFTVREMETLPSTAVEEVTLSDWPLTLFTCDLSGNNRFTVRLTKDA